MRRIIKVLLATVLASAALTSDASAKVVRKPGFSLTLPEGWFEIPPSAIATATKELHRQAPKVEIHKYDYGFQAKLTRHWLTYPYLLVQVNNTAKVSEEELKALETVAANNLVRSQLDSLKPVASNISLGKMQYDHDARIVWVYSQSDVAGIGRVLGLTGIVLTDTGTITVHAFARERTFQQLAPIFRDIVKSVSPSPIAAPAVRWTDCIRWVNQLDWRGIRDPVQIGMIVGAAAGCVGALFAGLYTLWHNAA